MASDEQINDAQEPASEPPLELPECQDDTDTLRRVLDGLTELAA